MNVLPVAALLEKAYRLALDVQDSAVSELEEKGALDKWLLVNELLERLDEARVALFVADRDRRNGLEPRPDSSCRRQTGGELDGELPVEPTGTGCCPCPAKAGATGRRRCP